MPNDPTDEEAKVDIDAGRDALRNPKPGALGSGSDSGSGSFSSSFAGSGSGSGSGGSAGSGASSGSSQSSSQQHIGDRSPANEDK